MFTFKRLGERHSELTLPLVTQLLEIHPFFDVTEPDIEDASYLCILVLVFNAAQHCPTMEPLLDQHTKRHYHFLLDTYPHLMPEKERKSEHKKHSISNTEAFLKQTLVRVNDSEHMSMMNRIKLLKRSTEDLKRVGSIEPSLYDKAQFVHLYLQCQSTFLKTLASRFWCNPQSLSAQQLTSVETNIGNLFSLCLQLQHRFTGHNDKEIFLTKLLKINILSLQILFLVRASNKSALSATEQFLREVESLDMISDDKMITSSPFLSALIKKLIDADDHKPGNMARILQPLLLAHPLESLSSDSSIALSKAVIFEPHGMNETPLKYTAGMVLAVPVDCELFNINDLSLVRVAIKTPDQKIQLVTPKANQFLAKEDTPNCHRYKKYVLWFGHWSIKIISDVFKALMKAIGEPWK